MGIHTRYGKCRGCVPPRWVPRDEMLSINVSIYDEENEEEKIQLRFCPVCHEKYAKMIYGMQWDNVLLTEIEIMTNPELAENSDLDFDDSEAAMRNIGAIQ